MQELLKKVSQVRWFHLTLYSVLLLNNSRLGDSLDRNYPLIEHEINDITNTWTGSVSYLDIHLNINTDIQLRTTICPSFCYAAFGLCLWYIQTFHRFFFTIRRINFKPYKTLQPTIKIYNYHIPCNSPVFIWSVIWIIIIPHFWWYD